MGTEVSLKTTGDLLQRGDIIPAGRSGQPKSAHTYSVEFTPYFTARHRYLANKITDYNLHTGSYLSGMALGNSLVQGSGTSGAGAIFTSVLGDNLADWYGYGTGNNWTPSNYGVGATTIANTVAYLAYDGDIASTKMVKRGSALSGKDYVIIMSLRNDADGGLTVGNYSELLRTAFRQCLRRKVDVFFVTEPPEINPTTGVVLDDDTTWTPWYEAAKRICGEEGVTLIDEWQYWYDKKLAGYDLRDNTSDGIHYDDEAHTRIANQILAAMKAPTTSNTLYSACLDSRGYAVGKFVDTASTATSSISSLTTTSTARNVVLATGSDVSYKIAGSSSLLFSSPIQARGVIVTMIGGGSNTGTATISYGYVGIAGATGLSGGATVREVSYYLPFNSGDVNAAYKFGNKTECEVAAVGGQIEITGVTFVGAITSQYNSPWKNVVETTGSWGDGALTSGQTARYNNAVGATATYRFFGTGIHFKYRRDSDQGKFTYAIDGGGTTEVNAYLAGVADSELEIKNLTRDWHTLVITITTKDASAGDNYVGIGEVTVYDYEPKPTTMYIEATVGNTVQIPDYWERAVIHEVLVTAPLPPDFTPGDSTLTLRGTGAAIIRLER